MSDLRAQWIPGDRDDDGDRTERRREDYNDPGRQDRGPDPGRTSHDDPPPWRPDDIDKSIPKDDD